MNIFLYIYIFNLSLNTGISKIDLVNCPLTFSSINLHKLSNIRGSGENDINVKN